SPLDNAGAADQPLADRGRQQIELVLRRQRRLAARGRGRNRGGVIDQEGGDAAMEEAALLQQLLPAIDRDRASAARQLRELGTDEAHISLAADILANETLDRRKVRIDLLDHGTAPFALSVTSARIAQATS